MDQTETMMCQPFHNQRRQRRVLAGMTLVEIILCLLILGTGLLGAVALVQLGLRQAAGAIAACSAESTAATALEDHAVLYDPITSAPAVAPATASGYVNGYWVERARLDTTTLAGSGGDLDLIQVKVYWGAGGQEVAGITGLVKR